MNKHITNRVTKDDEDPYNCSTEFETDEDDDVSKEVNHKTKGRLNTYNCNVFHPCHSPTMIRQFVPIFQFLSLILCKTSILRNLFSLK